MKLVRDEWHVLTGSYAVDALTDQEREGFERHLHHCLSCDAEVRGLRETAARLAMARSLRPPPGLYDRVLAATYRTRQLPPSAGDRPFRLRPVNPPRLLAARLATTLRRTTRLFLRPVSPARRQADARRRRMAGRRTIATIRSAQRNSIMPNGRWHPAQVPDPGRAVTFPERSAGTVPV